MSIVARKFNASPARLSSATWKAITEVVCQDDGDATKEFQQVAGVSSSLINDRLFKNHPLVVKNEGPRLRIYCLYGEDATTGEDSNENGLSWKPTAKQWHVFLPCLADEIKEMASILKGKSIKFSVYDVEKGIPDDTEEEKTGKSASAQAAVAVDWQAFKGL